MAYVESRPWMTTRWPVFSGGIVISCGWPPNYEFYCRVLTGGWNSNGSPEFKVLGPYGNYEEAQRTLIKHGKELMEKDKAALEERERMVNNGVCG